MKKYEYTFLTIDFSKGDNILTKLNSLGEQGYKVMDVNHIQGGVTYLLARQKEEILND